MILEMKGVGKTFTHKKQVTHAVRDVHCTIAPGQIVGLIGPNGAGKSTLMRMIAMLMKPTAGTIVINGWNAVTQQAQAKKQIGFVALDTHLPEYMNARQILRYFGSLFEMRGDTLEARIEELANLLRFQAYMNKPYGDLSTGNKQKISIARSLLHRPALLVMDEPSSGLDILALGALRELVQTLKQQGTGILISSHILQDILLCDHLLVMHDGQLIRSESLRDIGSSLVSLEDYYVKAVQSS